MHIHENMFTDSGFGSVVDYPASCPPPNTFEEAMERGFKDVRLLYDSCWSVRAAVLAHNGDNVTVEIGRMKEDPEHSPEDDAEIIYGGDITPNPITVDKRFINFVVE